MIGDPLDTPRLFTMIEVDINKSSGKWPLSTHTVIQRCIQTCCDELMLNQYQAELSFVLHNDKDQAVLNQQWRGKPKSTNVLSFPQIKPFSEPRGLLGDICLAFETIASEAEANTLDFDHHLAHLVVHGFLHILGHDHEEDKSAEIMQDIEKRVLARMGINDPYGSHRVDQMGPSGHG